jgi:N-[(2S)-2-amino-2-carboxyethyl]-L-glutamate dehydrogenase
MAGLELVPGPTVSMLLESNWRYYLHKVRALYLLHSAGRAVCPNSVFLRPPYPQGSRIIALPGWVSPDAEPPAIGLKWISSFPENVRKGLPRASGLIVLNDPDTGAPTTVMDAAAISAFRTAALATVAVAALANGDGRRLGIIGCGVISQQTLKLLLQHEHFSDLAFFDLDRTRAVTLAAEFSDSRTRIARDSNDVLRHSDVVLIARP